MPKKRAKKAAVKRQRANITSSRIKIFIFVAVLLAIGLVGKSLMATETYKVLGATTLLAKGGDDSGGGSNLGSGSSGSSNSGSSGGGSGSSNSDSSGSSGSENNGSSVGGLGGSGSISNIGGSSSGASASDNTKVICTGPDGKQFETKRKDCEELNKSWNKPANFTIIPNQNQTKTTKRETRIRSVIPSQSPSVTNSPEVENENESGVRTLIETKSNEERTEVRLSETERIRTRTKDGRTRIDITSGGIKTRLEIRDDRVVIKAEQEDGTEVELENDTLFKIDDRLAKDNIKVATAGAEQFLLQKGTTGAVTDFPVSVDLATNTVFINTPSGQRTITVLPEQAIQNLIAANIVNRLGGRAVVDEATNNNLTSVSQLIILGEKNGIPVYEINGISNQKLLGFIPVLIEKEVTVSAETGNALSINESLSARILDAISF